MIYNLADLMANDWLSGNHKIVFWAIRKIIHELRYDPYNPDTEPVLIYYTQIECRTGLGYSTVKRLVKELDDYGLFTRTFRKYRKNGQSRTDVLFSLAAHVITSAKNIKAPDRGHGGARTPRCEKCGSENVKPTAYTCLDCGHHGLVDQ